MRLPQLELLRLDGAYTSWVFQLELKMGPVSGAWGSGGKSAG